MNKAVAPAYLIQGDNVILILDGKSHTISRNTHIAYPEIVEALKAKDWDALHDLVEPKKVLVNFGAGNITIKDDLVYWKNEIFHNSLSTRMVKMYQDNFPIDSMIAFMANLMQNPSKRSVDQLYGFLEKNNLPITEDGYFLAFKKVSNSYMDLHTRTIDNNIGQTVEMDRNKVDDNPDSHCSVGLHFCSESYLKSFGGSDNPVMILKIHPADVVSIPTDYDGAKGRCSKYVVVGQVAGDAKNAFSSIVNNDYSPREASKKSKVNSVKDFMPQQLSIKNPAAAWPFPVSTPATPSKAATKSKLYSVRRMTTGAVEYSDVSLDVAREMVQRHVRQKKAKLLIFENGTNKEVK